MTRRGAIGLIPLAVACLVLAACGSGTKAAEPASQPAPPPAETDLTVATAGLTVDDPGPGEALQSFVKAAASGDTEALWALLTPSSQKRLGPTVDDFAGRFGTGFRDGVGTFAGTDYKVVLSRRDDQGWGVAAVAGNRVRAGAAEFAAYAAAARREGDQWLLELGAPIMLRRLVDAPTGSLQVQMSADAPIEAAGLWIDGEAIPASVEGRRGDFVVTGELPSTVSGNPVVVTFARTDETAAAGAFPLLSGTPNSDEPSTATNAA